MTTADQISLVGALFTGLSALASLAVLVATWRIVKATDASVQVMKAQQRGQPGHISKSRRTSGEGPPCSC